ncbi:MAG: SagB/ThcOx family dehydrogenase [Bryobacteraceae bacterium]|nr:SagB/ThcOx family dehydrogenase [Bryobacteraceae bacterium]
MSLPALRPDTRALEECLRLRRSTREYATRALSLSEAGQLLWAAQGVTGPGGLRTAPSAGAVYPLRVYLGGWKVKGLGAGLYRYRPDEHALEPRWMGDRREALCQAAAGQECVEAAPVSILLTANLTRMTKEFGEHARRLALLEAGHVGQNLGLEAAGMQLGLIGLGRFVAERVRELLEIPATEEPLYLFAAGAPLA